MDTQVDMFGGLVMPGPDPRIGSSKPPRMGQFRTVVIDPPWPVSKIRRVVRPNQGVSLDYKTIPLEVIKTLPVPDIADRSGSHIYLWTTHKYLPAAFALFKHWGIVYHVTMTWVKNVGITPYSWMYSTEFVLMGKYGSLPLLKMGERVDFYAPVGKHSEKPDVFYLKAEYVSPGPRIDLFARQQHRRDWYVWGDEVRSDIPLTWPGAAAVRPVEPGTGKAKRRRNA